MQVPLLLRDIHIEMRTLGAELLAVFTRVQSPVDSKLEAIQAHVPQVRQAVYYAATGTNSSGSFPKLTPALREECAWIRAHARRVGMGCSVDWMP